MEIYKTNQNFRSSKSMGSTRKNPYDGGKQSPFINKRSESNGEKEMAKSKMDKMIK